MTSLKEGAFNRALDAFEECFHEAYARQRSTVDNDGQAFHEAAQEALELAFAVAQKEARPYLVEVSDEDGDVVDVISTWATDAPDAIERVWPRVQWEREQRQDDNIMPSRAYPDGVDDEDHDWMREAQDRPQTPDFIRDGGMVPPSAYRRRTADEDHD